MVAVRALLYRVVRGHFEHRRQRLHELDIGQPVRRLAHAGVAGGRMIEWGKTGDVPQRIVQENLLGLENSLKVYRGLQSALLDDRLMDFKTTRERELRERVSNDAKLAQQTGSAWDDVGKSQARYREIYDRYLYLESGTGFNTDLFFYARLLVRGAAERAKPNEQRLREYADSNLPKMSAGLLAATPIYPEFETLTFAFSLD
jgi:hypothetical protein